MTAIPERLFPGQPGWNFAGHQHLQRYVMASELAAGADVLDWACGVGYGSLILASGEARQVTGADRAEEALAYAREHYRHPRLRFVNADGMQAPPANEAYDLVVSFETIEHLPDPRRFVAHLHAALRSRGRLILSAPNAWQHSRHPTRPLQNAFHHSEPDFDELLSWLSPHFDVVRAWEQTPFSDRLVLEAANAAIAQAQRGGYLWCRTLNALENMIRRMARRPLPPRPPLETGWPARWSEIVPLLPERRSDAHTFILLCQKR